MTEDNDKILNDINNSGGEIEKEEHLLYNKFLEYHSKSINKTAITETKIIEFIPVKNEEVVYEPDLRQYAAESEAGSANSGIIQSYFYISADDKYALKCISISGDEICVNVLSETSSNEEMILFLPELNKYFLPNNNGDYIITGASAKNLNKINFKVYLIKEKIKIYEDNNSYSFFAVNNLCKPDISEKNDSFIIIKLHSSELFSKAALINDKVREFLNMEDDLIQLPFLFLKNNSVIYLF